ncbi:MAG: ABC transporter substrate-binding protein [Acidimicrobiia bacterium]
MKKRTISVLLVVLALMAAAVSALPAGAQSSGDKPQDIEVGVTATELHIAVVADVENPLAPGLFKGAVTGVKAAANYLNSKAGGGGLAGRKVVVDFYDSKLAASETRNSVIKACQNDVAMVGTEVLFLTNVDDIVNCPDKAGQAVGIPDLAGFSTGVPETCNPMAFPAQGASIDCSQITNNPQTYYGNAGIAKYLLKQNKNDLHGPMIMPNDTKDANRGGTVIALGYIQAGVKPEQGQTVARSGRDPQSAYTNIVQQMKSDGSNWAFSSLAANGVLALRDEAQIQGIDAKSVSWLCSACYGNTTVSDNASSFEGEWQPLGYLPFNETSKNATLKAFVTNVEKLGEQPDSFSLYGFQAAIAFRDAVNATVKAHGVNGLTRTNLIAGIKTLTDFDADGMVGTHSFKTGITSSCFVASQFVNGKWVRKYPSKPGTFDCKASNTETIKANLNG